MTLEQFTRLLNILKEELPQWEKFKIKLNTIGSKTYSNFKPIE